MYLTLMSYREWGVLYKDVSKHARQEKRGGIRQQQLPYL